MKVTLFKFLKYLFPLVVTNILIVCVFYYWFYDDASIMKDKEVLLVFGLILSIPLIPQLVLLINHYKISRHLVIEKGQKSLKITELDRHFEIHEENIISWQLIGTSSKIQKSSTKYTIADDLFYIKVFLKNGIKIHISSMVDKNIDKFFVNVFPSVKTKDKKTLFPMIKSKNN